MSLPNCAIMYKISGSPCSSGDRAPASGAGCEGSSPSRGALKESSKLKEIEKTIEVRWHGRGGQGAVTSAELLALAAIEEGKFAQAFPSFGPERRGAPVLVFNRLSNTAPIRARVSVTE